MEETLVVLTSNGERQLPNAFLRRCVHHHLHFDRTWLTTIVESRIKSGDLTISAGLVKHAIDRFVALQAIPGLRHKPGLSELLVWLRILGMAGNIDPEALKHVDVGRLPYLGSVIKDPSDLALTTSRVGR